MNQAGLIAGADRLGVSLADAQADALLHYVALLERWNARFNLVSRRDIGRIWPRHILDSLSIAPVLNGIADQASVRLRVFDIGTGAGLPGLPLAVALPHMDWLLLDRNQRKIRFLETVIGELGITNAGARVADLGRRTPDDLKADDEAEGAGADVVVSRAVDEPVGLLKVAAPLLKPSGQLVLMTGTRTDEESPEDGIKLDPDGGFLVSAVHELAIPGLDRAHEVTIIERAV